MTCGLNAKHYFRPGNIRSIVSALNRARANPGAFLVSADRFPHWEEIADRTIGVYEKLFAEDTVRTRVKRKPSRI